jgi:hypothetical protein
MKRYKADLHIHTIYSEDYKTKSEPDKCINAILRKCYEKEINIIAFTDHNTIAAYKKYSQLKDNIRQEYDFIKKYSITDEKTKDVEELYQIYNYVNVFPGVELEVNPGVHIVIIFNPKIEINTICNYVKDFGYSESDNGQFIGEAKKDIFNLLDTFDNKEVIIYAPHIENSKGLLYVFEKNPFLSKVIKHPALDGISCNNSSTLKKLKDFIKDIKRDKPLVFLEASDAHNLDEIGSRTTFFNLEDISFNKLKESFFSPELSISTVENKLIIELIKEIIESNRCLCVSSLIKDEIKKSIIAIFNKGLGYIIIGAIDSNIITGIKTNKDIISNMLNEIYSEIMTSNGYLDKFDTLIEEISENKLIAIIAIKNQYGSIGYFNDKVYIVDDCLHEATLKEVIKLTQKKAINKMSNQNYEIFDLFEKTIKSYSNLLNQSEFFLIQEKIENEFNTLDEIFDIDIFESNNDIIKDFQNGVNKGNTIFIQKGSCRLEYALLRCSIPIFNSMDNEYIKNYINQDCIIIADGGATYIVENYSYPLKIASSCDYIVLTLKDEYKDKYSLFSILGWLKSSLLLWYVLYTKNSCDYFNKLVFQKIILPKKDIFKAHTDLEKVIIEIIQKEQDFLNIDDLKEDDIDSHNRNIDRLAIELDSLLYKVLKIDDKMQKMIYNFLENRSIYIFNEENAAENVENNNVVNY